VAHVPQPYLSGSLLDPPAGHFLRLLLTGGRTELVLPGACLLASALPPDVASPFVRGPGLLKLPGAIRCGDHFLALLFFLVYVFGLSVLPCLYFDSGQGGSDHWLLG